MSHFMTQASRLHSPATSLCWLSQWLIANIYMESVYEGNKAVLVSQYGLFNGTVFCLSSFPQPGNASKVMQTYPAQVG